MTPIVRDDAAGEDVFIDGRVCSARIVSIPFWRRRDEARASPLIIAAVYPFWKFIFFCFLFLFFVFFLNLKNVFFIIGHRHYGHHHYNYQTSFFFFFFFFHGDGRRTASFIIIIIKKEYIFFFSFPSTFVVVVVATVHLPTDTNTQ